VGESAPTKLIERHGLTNVRLIPGDAAQLSLDEHVDVAHFSLSYSVMPDRDASLDRAWQALRPGGLLAIMDAGIPYSRLGRMLGPAAEIIATVFPGDPYSRPWEDLKRLGPPVCRLRLGCARRRAWWRLCWEGWPRGCGTPDGSARSMAVSMACGYQGFEKPSTSSSRGMTSSGRPVSVWRQRQTTGESLASLKPRARSRSPKR
jgi:SAM-dependent methyltransferase